MTTGNLTPTEIRNSRLTLVLSSELRSALQKRCKETERSPSSYVLWLIKKDFEYNTDATYPNSPAEKAKGDTV